jgi:hypothetical protein
MRIKSILLSLSLCAIATLSIGAAQASTNLVQNGNFELTSKGTNKQLASSTAKTGKTETTLLDWTSSDGNNGGYNFVLNTNIATTSKSAIWLNGTNNGYTASPDGANVFASDGAYHPGTLSQSISGLTIGKSYTLTFDYALAQQVGFKGANSNDYWAVSLGGVTKDSTGLSIAQGGFSGWETATMTFTASKVNEALSFLAVGSNPSSPPFLLLDGVSLVAAVPEPSSWAMMLIGVGMIGFLARRRAKQA